MTMCMIGLAGIIALAPTFAAAQALDYGSPANTLPAQAPQPNGSHAALGGAARDGCVNVPGEMHNSSDCMKINPEDFNPSKSDFQTDLSGRPTGASENSERNARIAADMGRPMPDRDYDRDGYPR
jgi:hypothetical protein